MEVSSKIIVKRFEIQVEKRESITAEVAFKVANLPVGFNMSSKFSVPVTKEISEHIAMLKVLIAEQVGEIITKDEGDDE